MKKVYIFDLCIDKKNVVLCYSCILFYIVDLYIFEEKEEENVEYNVEEVIDKDFFEEIFRLFECRKFLRVRK